VEQKQQRTRRYDEFAEQFVSLLAEHWSDILLIINRQSLRIASLLCTASPVSLRRVNGNWHIQIIVSRISQYEGLCSPRDGEIVAQAIRLWAHSRAQLRLPRVSIEFACARPS
jgi:hypothetical protein